MTRFKAQGGCHHGRFQRSNSGPNSPTRGRNAPDSNRTWWYIWQGLLRAGQSPRGDRPPAEPPTPPYTPVDVSTPDGSHDVSRATARNRARRDDGAPRHQGPHQRPAATGVPMPIFHRDECGTRKSGRLLRCTRTYDHPDHPCNPCSIQRSPGVSQ